MKAGVWHTLEMVPKAGAESSRKETELEQIRTGLGEFGRRELGPLCFLPHTCSSGIVRRHYEHRGLGLQLSKIIQGKAFTAEKTTLFHA